jgi:hypothetical protein
MDWPRGRMAGRIGATPTLDRAASCAAHLAYAILTGVMPEESTTPDLVELMRRG